MNWRCSYAGLIFGKKIWLSIKCLLFRWWKSALWHWSSVEVEFSARADSCDGDQWRRMEREERYSANWINELWSAVPRTQLPRWKRTACPLTVSTWNFFGVTLLDAKSKLFTAVYLQKSYLIEDTAVWWNQ